MRALQPGRKRLAERSTDGASYEIGDSMETLRAWLVQHTERRKVLDLGCGEGSFDYQLLGRSGVVGVDLIAANLNSPGVLLPVRADAAVLPLPEGCFDLVICHHSLEHFRDARSVVREIDRVIKPRGELYISVPDGSGLSDRLYRLLMAGGGHVQRFSFSSLVELIESETDLRLHCWQNLYTSFIYVDKPNFLPAPAGRLPGPLPRRMRLLGLIPAPMFEVIRFGLNAIVRLTDRWLGSKLSLDGWAFAFTEVAQAPFEEPGLYNVCMKCGCGLRAEELTRRARFLYRCPRCRCLNPMFTTPVGSR